MSILLEALKKSEKQRQLGATPDIHSSGDHKPERGDGGHHWVPLGLVITALLAMSWFGWKQYERPEGLETIAATESASDVGASTKAVPEEPGVNTARTPVESFTAADSGQPRADGADTADEGDIESRREDVSRSFSEYQPAPGSEMSEPPTRPSSELSQEGLADAGDQDGRIQSAEQAAADDADLAEQPAESRELEPHISQPITYWELPQSVRNNLPVIRITVLVFADTPADRFALINGQRMVEDEELGDGVVLREIRRDGAVFSYRNYRFLVKG